MNQDNLIVKSTITIPYKCTMITYEGNVQHLMIGDWFVYDEAENQTIQYNIISEATFLREMVADKKDVNNHFRKIVMKFPRRFMWNKDDPRSDEELSQLFGEMMLMPEDAAWTFKREKNIM